MLILETGYYPPDTASGTFDSELEGYVSEEFFELTSPLGGKWDFEWNDLGGVWSAVGVSGSTIGDDVFRKVDDTIDDGNLGSGFFRKFGDGNYYFILEE